MIFKFSKTKMFQISFMLPEDTVPGRMGFLLTLFLCMINILNSEATNSPKSGGAVTAIILWISSCSVFIIMAILEYALILCFKKYKEPSNLEIEAAYKSTKEIKNKNPHRCVDMWMMVIVPPVFLTFAIIFWSIQFYGS